MNVLLRNRATPVWILLVLCTGLSWWLGGITESADALNIRYVSTAMIIVAFIKVRFVIQYFMEVRTAAVALKLLCDAWVLIVFFAIIGLYWRVL